MNNIITFLEEGHRHKLIVTASLDSLNLEVIDVGYQLSLAVKDKLSSRVIGSVSKDKLNRIIEEGIKEHSIFGKYVAINNLGILFEQQLKIDISYLLENHSKNQVLLIEWKGDIENNTLFYLSKHSGNKISLDNITYLKL